MTPCFKEIHCINRTIDFVLSSIYFVCKTIFQSHTTLKSLVNVKIMDQISGTTKMHTFWWEKKERGSFGSSSAIDFHLRNFNKISFMLQCFSKKASKQLSYLICPWPSKTNISWYTIDLKTRRSAICIFALLCLCKTVLLQFEKHIVFTFSFTVMTPHH